MLRPSAKGFQEMATDFKKPADSDLMGLDRPGIWSFMWRMRQNGANTRQVRSACRRWEKLTGLSYYSGEGR